MDFSTLKGIEIPNGVVQNIKVNSSLLWEKSPEAPSYIDLVPNALNKDGTILDGKGYRTGYYWNVGSLASASAFTAIGLIPISGTVQHDIYVYGINFTGTARNKFGVHGENFSNLNEAGSLKDGFTHSIVSSVTKLADNYFKIRTTTYSTKVKYFAISGVTVSGLTPIVTMDEPIM